MADRMIFHVGTLDLPQTVELVLLGRGGVNSLASIPPYDFPRIRVEWVVRHFLAISKVHPTILYNFPLASSYGVPSTLANKIVQEGGIW
jgi:dihydrodipicolinate synthase/N-acetylneuraminate lyase